MVYIIRFLQMVLLAVIPSAITTFAIRQQPNEVLWIVLCSLAFIVFVIGNMIFNRQIYFITKGDIREYMIISIPAYILYIIFTVVAYKTSDPMLFSMLCANLRAFEPIVDKTRYSMIVSHLMVMIIFILQPYMMKRKEQKLSEEA